MASTVADRLEQIEGICGHVGMSTRERHGQQKAGKP
jgi:hypothetical protein